MLEKGQRLTGLTFKDSEGKAYSLDDFRDKRAVIFFFYPMDFSPGCTKQACLFRDYYQEITSLGAEVFGVSTDSSKTHLEFRDKHQLPFPLIPDAGRVLSRQFGVGRWGGWLGNRRATFAVAPDGTILEAYHDEWNVAAHIERVIELLTELKQNQR